MAESLSIYIYVYIYNMCVDMQAYSLLSTEAEPLNSTWNLTIWVLDYWRWADSKLNLDVYVCNTRYNNMIQHAVILFDGCR